MALRQRWLGHSLAWLTFPVFWFLHEWFRCWFMTGFPWLFAGDAHLFTWLSGWGADYWQLRAVIFAGIDHHRHGGCRSPTPAAAVDGAFGVAIRMVAAAPGMDTAQR